MTLAPVVLVNFPNVPDVTLVVIPERFEWLKKLNMSVRNCRRTRSVIAIFFPREKFRSQRPGDRTAPFPTLPGRSVAPEAGPTGTRAKAALLRYSRVSR